VISWLRVLVSRLNALFRKGRLKQKLDEELRSHLKRQVEENISAAATTIPCDYTKLESHISHLPRLDGGS
jgi:hypothetical protein